MATLVRNPIWIQEFTRPCFHLRVPRNLAHEFHQHIGRVLTSPYSSLVKTELAKMPVEDQFFIFSGNLDA